MNRIHNKPEYATTGFFYLDHVPTGKVYTGTSTNMQQSIQDLSESLKKGTCKHKTLTKLHQIEADFKARCTVTRSLRQAEKAEKEFRKELPPYLIINR